MPEAGQALVGAEPSNTPEQPSQPTPGVATYDVPNVGPVAVDELVKGYMRQNDYTQKTQSLSQEREQVQLMQDLANALEANPQETLASLAEAYEVQLGATSTPAVDAENLPISSGQEQLPPEVANSLNRMNQFMEEQEKRELRQEIEREISECKSKYGDFDEASVIHFAYTRGIPDIEVAYLAWDRQQAFEKGMNEGLTNAEARVQATVEGGTSVPVGSPEISEKDPYGDAVRFALRGSQT